MRHRHPSPPVEYQDDAAFRRSVRFKRALRLSEKDEHDRVAFEMLQLTAKERLLVELHSVQKKFRTWTATSSAQCSPLPRTSFGSASSRRESRDGRVI